MLAASLLISNCFAGSGALLIVASAGADSVEELSAGAEVENELSSANRVRNAAESYADQRTDTHVEVMARLEEVVELDDVGVASRDLLQDSNLIADHVLAALACQTRNEGPMLDIQ